MESINIAENLSPEELKKIARDVYEDYLEDEQSRQEFLERAAINTSLYYMNHRPETPLWAGASQESLPLLTEACNQFQARAYKAFFPTRNFVSAVAVNSLADQDKKTAERVAKHINYQLTAKDTNYRKDKRAMFLATALHGNDFAKVFYDPTMRMVRSVRVRSTDLCMPYGIGPRSMDQIERKTQIIPMTFNHSLLLANDGWFTSPISPKSDDKLENKQVQEVIDRTQGFSSGKSDDWGAVIEQHCLLDIDGDGVPEPYIVWVDIADITVKRISIRYEVNQRGEAVPDKFGRTKHPFEHFIHYEFLPNPDGAYANGYGVLLGPLNIALNKLLRQQIDAGTLANIGNMSGFVSKSLGLKSDRLELDIGYFQTIERNVEDIRKGIFQFQFPGPNPALNVIFEKLSDRADRVASNTDAVTGSVDKVLQPLTIMTLLESSLQMPSSVMEQMALSFEEELAKIYYLNRKHFRRQETFIDQNEEITITPKDYESDVRLYPVIDPKNITQQQKVARAQESYNFIMSNQQLASNPTTVTEASRRVLEALEVEDIDRLIPPPPEPARIDNQDIENHLYLLPAAKRPLFDVFPDQDHVAHILSINEFLKWLTVNDPIEDVPLELSQQPNIDAVIKSVAGQLKEGVVAELILHLAQHVAYFYAQTKGAIGGQGQQGSMGAQQGNDADVERAIREIQSMGIPIGLRDAGGNAPSSGANSSLGFPAGVFPQGAESGLLGLGIGSDSDPRTPR